MFGAADYTDVMFQLPTGSRAVTIGARSGLSSHSRNLGIIITALLAGLGVGVSLRRVGA
jgi:hypothetical protein